MAFGPDMGQDSTEGNNRKQICAALESKPSLNYVSEHGSSGKYPGGPIIEKCDALTKAHFTKFFSNGRDTGASKFDWTLAIDKACSDKCLNKTEFDKCRDENKIIAKSCVAGTFVVSKMDRDWADNDQVKPAKIQSAANAPTGAQANANFTTIKCESAGVETVDFESCKKFQNQLQVIEAVQQVSYGAQEMVYQGKMADAQIKHNTDTNTATGALKATADSLKMQQDMYQQRTAVDATKLAYLYSIYNDMPTTTHVADACNGLSYNKDEISVDANYCKKVIQGVRGEFNLLMNGPQREAMKMKLITIATSAGSNLILANLLGKRAKDANNAIANIEAFKPIDPTIVSEEEAQTTFCKMNPGLPQCLGAGLDGNFDTIADNVITFGDGVTGTNYGSTTPAIDSDYNPTGEATGDRSTVTPMGSVITAAVKDNSIEASKAATVTSKGNGGAFGGGGGGGASASSGSGGAPNTGAAPGGGVSPAIAGKAPAYAGGAGSISVVGGFGINKSKGEGKSEENPFGKLFGKDGKASGVVNFREPAAERLGGKGDNIFDMISKRYTTVHANKRLLEYELAK